MSSFSFLEIWLKKDEGKTGLLCLCNIFAPCTQRNPGQANAQQSLTSESLLQWLDLLIALFLQLCQFLLFAQLTDRRHTLPVFDLCSAVC